MKAGEQVSALSSLRASEKANTGKGMELMTATREALADLQFHWGGAYMITGSGRHWIAQRRDNGRILIASSPDGLRELIFEDYTAQPVGRDRAPGAAS